MLKTYTLFIQFDPEDKTGVLSTALGIPESQLDSELKALAIGMREKRSEISFIDEDGDEAFHSLAALAVAIESKLLTPSAIVAFLGRELASMINPDPRELLRRALKL